MITVTFIKRKGLLYSYMEPLGSIMLCMCREHATW